MNDFANFSVGMSAVVCYTAVENENWARDFRMNGQIDGTGNTAEMTNGTTEKAEDTFEIKRYGDIAIIIPSSEIAMSDGCARRCVDK